MSKAYNKIMNRDGTVYIDLTNDTVTADSVLYGHTVHLPNGTRVEGSFLSGNPTTFTISGNIVDSNGNDILDSSSISIDTEIIYYHASYFM